MTIGILNRLTPWKIKLDVHKATRHTVGEGMIEPEEISHKLTEVEADWLGWTFHVTDEKYRDSLPTEWSWSFWHSWTYCRDSLDFMYENDGGTGYSRKGTGTQQSRHYSSTIYCVLNVRESMKGGYDLFLTMNGTVVVYDDIPLRYFNIVRSYPHLANVLKPPVAHNLPREVLSVVWRQCVSDMQKYMGYLYHQVRYPSTLILLVENLCQAACQAT